MAAVLHLRSFIGLLGVALLAACIGLYAGATSRQGTEVTTTTKKSPKGANPASQTVTRTEKSIEAPPAQSRPDAIIVGVVGFALALLASALFWDRVEEVVIAGTTIRLRRDDVAKAVSTITDRTTDPEKVERALGGTIRRLETRQRAEGRRVRPEDVTLAAEEAIDELVPNLAREVDVERTETDVRVAVDSVGSGPDVSSFRITTDYQFLPEQSFGTHPAKAIMAAADDRRLAAVERSTDQVIAALSYELPREPRTPIVITALTTDARAPEVPRRLAALKLTQYLDAIATALDRPPGALIRLVEPTEADLTELGAMHFRVAAEEDTAGVPPGRYLRQQPTTRS